MRYPLEPFRRNYFFVFLLVLALALTLFQLQKNSDFTHSAQEVQAAARSPHFLELYIYNDDWLLLTCILITLILTLLSFFLLRDHLRLATALQAAHEANEKLSCQESLLRAIYDSSGLSLLLLDSERNILYANQCIADLFQKSPTEVLGTDYCLYLEPSMREESKRNFHQALVHPQQPVFVERSHQLPDGNIIWYRAASRAFLDHEGKASGVVVVVEDITERRREEASLRLARTVFETSPVAIVVTDAQHRIVSANAAYVRISGYTLPEVLGEKKTMLLIGKQNSAFYRDMLHTIRAQGHWNGEVVSRRKSGEVYPQMLSIAQVLDKNNAIAYYVSMFLDITERQQAEERIRYLAHHDYLTNLPNRVLFLEKSAQALILARRYHRQLGILFIDLDRFKPINDNYGHDAGDALLCAIAHRLRKAIRKSDTVCRQGGDEFVILLPEIKDRESLAGLAETLLQLIEQPCAFEEHQLQVSASIGIATYPENGNAVDEIIQSADSAMYAAKAHPETHICFAPPKAQKE
nr:diguanylate cyclase [uncultured Anaeromusa sp.]